MTIFDWKDDLRVVTRSYSLSQLSLLKMLPHNAVASSWETIRLPEKTTITGKSGSKINSNTWPQTSGSTSYPSRFNPTTFTLSSVRGPTSWPRGMIPKWLGVGSCFAPIFERLKLDVGYWKLQIQEFGRLFSHMAGNRTIKNLNNWLDQSGVSPFGFIWFHKVEAQYPYVKWLVVTSKNGSSKIIKSKSVKAILGNRS